MKSYFFSDLHFGYPSDEISRERERRLCSLLSEIEPETSDLWFLGDIFDFWWEYKSVVPAGFTRFFAKILEFTEAGIPVYFFSGNHDVWMRSYLSRELGVRIIHQPLEVQLQGKTLYLAHGDGLGPGDNSYKLLKKIFTNRFLQWAYSRLHPNFAFCIARSWSHSRRQKEPYPHFESLDKELLPKHAKNLLTQKPYDYFVFGHRHVPMHLELAPGAELINTGEWLFLNTFACLEKGEMKLLQFEDDRIKKYPYPNPEKNPYIRKKSHTLPKEL